MNTATDLQFPQHSLFKSVLLHILPGALTTLVFVLIKPLLDPSGFPPLLAFLLAVLWVDLPLQLAIMLFDGTRLNGRLSLKGVILYRDKVSWKTFALIFVAAFVVVYLLITLVSPLTTYLANTVFSGLPEWMFLEESTQYSAFAKNAVIALFVLQLVLTGVALPWVEELYFRGYLLPRISRYGAWTPLLGGLLFALYHGWQLFGFGTVLLLGAALGYVVWWKRDIRLSISLHLFANVLTRLMLLVAALTL
jgi:membrane protease YdiL (CAAX protease family)